MWVNEILTEDASRQRATINDTILQLHKGRGTNKTSDQRPVVLLNSTTCARLTQEILDLTLEGTMCKAYDVLRDYHRSGIGAQYPTIPATISDADFRVKKKHAAEIALFVGQTSRAKLFHDMQEHIDTLQHLIQKHNVALDRLAMRARTLQRLHK